MGKLLRVLVVFLCFFSVGALVLGIMLFQKRELLKGRTQKLERAVIALGTTIESTAAEPQVRAFPAADADECTSELNANPQTSDFWQKKYKAHLETPDLEKLDLNKKRVQLTEYYLRNAVTDKIELDPVTRLKKTEGPGTMQEVLDDLLAKAGSQYDRLNDTREQLKDLREETIRIIEEMNKHKQDLRGRKNEIVQLNGTINNLNGTITQQRTQIGTLEEEKKALGFQISDLNREVDKLTQDNATLSNDVQRLVQRIEHLTRGVEGRKDGEEAKQTRRQLYITNIQPGQKGQIASVNEQWNFVVVQLSEPFLKEIMGEDLKAAPPQVDLFVKRSDSTFVTKVRLLQVDSGKQIGVADILKEWQQKPVQKGDVLFY